MNRAEVTKGGREFESEQIQCEPHEADFGEGIVTVLPSQGMQIAQVEDGDKAAVAIVVLVPGYGIATQLTPDEARKVAASLSRIAADIELKAQTQALAAIEKARGK